MFFNSPPVKATIVDEQMSILRPLSIKEDSEFQGHLEVKDLIKGE